MNARHITLKYPGKVIIELQDGSMQIFDGDKLGATVTMNEVRERIVKILPPGECPRPRGRRSEITFGDNEQVSHRNNSLGNAPDTIH